MMSMRTIAGIASEAAERAHEENQEPVVLGTGQFSSRPSPIPFIGSLVVDFDLPFEEVEEFFVDSSGFGSEGESALTQQEFERAAVKLVATAPEPIYWGITQVGQFQVYVTAYRRISGMDPDPAVAQQKLPAHDN